MSRITLNVGFYFKEQHYAQLQAYIPRSQALGIPQLRIQEREKMQKKEEVLLKAKQDKEIERRRRGRKPKAKQESDEDAEDDLDLEQQQDQDQDDQENMEIQEDEPNDMMDIEEDNIDEKALQQIDQDNFLQSDSSEESISLSSLSKSLSFRQPITKTKRQKGEAVDLIQLPDKRPRKDAKKYDEATEIIRREEKERKRKQYLKKQIEAQQKATLEKILNQTGRKLRLRQQKQTQQQIQRENKSFKSLGDVPKIISRQTESGTTITLHSTSLFPPHMLQSPQPKMRDLCSQCGGQGKYKLKSGGHVCSLVCYKNARH